MFIIRVVGATCKGCGDCADSCPVGILSVNGRGKATVSGRAKDCIGCDSCVAACETGSITVDEA